MADPNKKPEVGLAHCHSHWKDLKIKSLVFKDSQSYATEEREIIAYSEPGEMNYIIWFETRDPKTGRIISRLNGRHVYEVMFG